MPRDRACKLTERERIGCLVERPKDRVVENALGVAHGERWLPNGSRLSCGRNACWRKAAEPQVRGWPVRQRNSSLLGSARQLPVIGRASRRASELMCGRAG